MSEMNRLHWRAHNKGAPLGRKTIVGAVNNNIKRDELHETAKAR